MRKAMEDIGKAQVLDDKVMPHTDLHSGENVLVDPKPNCARNSISARSMNLRCYGRNEENKEQHKSKKTTQHVKHLATHRYLKSRAAY